MVFYFSLIFSGTNVHKNTYNTIFERYIFTLFKNLSGTDMLFILVELWYEMFWNFFVSQSLVSGFIPFIGKILCKNFKTDLQIFLEKQ